MKPKTVGRASGGISPQQRTCISHVGLVAGTIVLTSDGEIPVEFLSPGDRIITRNAGMVALNAIETEKVKIEAVRINAGALGHIKPPHTVMLPAAQTVAMIQLDADREMVCGMIAFPWQHGRISF